MTQHASQRGQTLPIFAIAAVLLLGAAGLAADAGYHQYQQRVQQTATDSAALAGAAELAIGSYQAAGLRDAASNGFADGQDGVSVTVGPPAAGDAFYADANAVEAEIRKTYPTFFERVFGITGALITTKAVAINNARSDLCMVALSTSGTSTINGHSTVDAPNCTIAINNSHLSIGGQSGITTQAPIQYSGSLTGSGTSTFIPSAPISALPVADPCPQIASCAYLQQNPPTTTPCVNFDAAAPVADQIYCSIDFGNAAVNLPQGWYVVTGDLKGNSATVYGTGVAIIDTSSKCPNLNNATLNLTAPTSGNYAGMLLYDKQCSNPITMNGGNSGLGGVIYVPNANLTMNAGAAAAIAIIAGQFSLNSANTTFSPPPVNPITQPRLVE